MQTQTTQTFKRFEILETPSPSALSGMITDRLLSGEGWQLYGPTMSATNGDYYQCMLLYEFTMEAVVPAEGASDAAL